MNSCLYTIILLGKPSAISPMAVCRGQSFVIGRFQHDVQQHIRAFLAIIPVRLINLDMAAPPLDGTKIIAAGATWSI